uniref:Coatomer subunit zeta n=1 Tax=Hucho hucho TaxID=62062 RepID=A0A4W5KZH3_9TELE
MDALSLEPTLYTVKAVLILDNDGERLYAKYYDETYPTVKEQKAFEKNIFNKTHRTDSEIALLEGLTVVYKSNIDLYFYVIGSSHENELMLMSVLNCLFDSLSQMLRKNVERRALLENMEGLFLAVDEIVDGGVQGYKTWLGIHAWMLSKTDITLRESFWRATLSRWCTVWPSEGMMFL